MGSTCNVPVYFKATTIDGQSISVSAPCMKRKGHHIGAGVAAHDRQHAVKFTRSGEVLDVGVGHT